MWSEFVCDEPQCVLKHILETEQKVDLIISCSDGKLGAHKILLASASSFIKMLLLGHKVGNSAFQLDFFTFGVSSAYIFLTL